MGWIAGIVITGFYLCLYFKDYTDKILQGNSLGGLIAMFDPISYLLRGRPSDQWFVYGSFYTLAVTIMGIKFIVKYRHNRYQQVRTISVMFFQLIFAWMLPGILLRLYNYEPYWSYFFPLDYDALFPSNLSYIASNGALGQFTIFWGLILHLLQHQFSLIFPANAGIAVGYVVVADLPKLPAIHFVIFLINH